jgi:hypothetical protein
MLHRCAACLTPLFPSHTHRQTSSMVRAKGGHELRPLTFFNGKYGLEKDATCPRNNSIRHALKRITCPIVLLAFCQFPIFIGFTAWMLSSAGVFFFYKASVHTADNDKMEKLDMKCSDRGKQCHGHEVQRQRQTISCRFEVGTGPMLSYRWGASGVAAVRCCYYRLSLQLRAGPHGPAPFSARCTVTKTTWRGWSRAGYMAECAVS